MTTPENPHYGDHMDTHMKTPSRSEQIEDLRKRVDLLERLLVEHVHPFGYAAIHRQGAEHDLVSVRDELATGITES